MKKYWKSLDEYQDIPDRKGDEIASEDKNAILDLFDKDISEAKASRRDFLKLFGFSVTTAAIAASCERPVQKAIPYIIQPDEVTPGKAAYYASSFYDGKDFLPVVVKVRDGRPIKIEGNKLSAFNRGGSTARAQASVLSLYDDARFKQPIKKGKKKDWLEVDNEITSRLGRLNEQGKEITLISPGIISPSLKSVIDAFGKQYKNFRHISYQAISCSAIADAMEENFGERFIPAYHIENADVLVSVGADFLGSWLAPAHFIPAYASRRKLDEGQKSMLKHIQLESGMSLTGSNADERIKIKLSEEKAILANLYNEVAKLEGAGLLNAPPSELDVAGIASRLHKAGSKAMIISGSNDIECQLLINAINHLLGNSGVCIDYNTSLNIEPGSDTEIAELVNRLEKDEVGAILMHNVDPVYDYPESERFSDALKNADLTVSFASSSQQTAAACEFVCPDHHYLESWGDANYLSNEVTLTQPCIHPVFNTRSLPDTLLKWMGLEKDYYTYLMEFWKKNFYTGKGSFENFWKSSLRDGVLATDNYIENRNYKATPLNISFSDPLKEDGMELCLVESVQLGDGRNANNPWLQELPDPVAKLSWDNALSVAPADANRMGISNGDMVSIDNDLEVPVLIQPGQADGTCSLPLGYGRKNSGKVADNVGVNAYPLVKVSEENRIYYRENISLQPTGKNIILALSQTHNSMEGRPIVRETSLPEYLKSPDAGNEMHEYNESHHKTLYPDPEFNGFHWGLAVDLNACVGCNTCVIACQAENNIPVVGKDEVYRRRIMHWMKIDRYYSEDPDNPEVSFQPVMCQHCDNAPCENVCPVSATNHSSEGLNQMSYNRCIGTKYCINNCPYRVRRFNWYKYVDNKEFDFNTHSDLGKMVLNPDVTVRGRGVVEKCSFCVQRIQEKKLGAKLENRTLKDGEIEPACVQACPAGALIFGDLRNKDSKVSSLYADPRNYHLLEELHTLPSVGYLTKVRNKDKDNLSS